MINKLTTKIRVTGFTCFSFLFCTFNLYSQCDNGAVWGGTGAPTDAAAATIHNCNYAGEHAEVSNIQMGNDYVITSSNCLDYITVYDDSGLLIGSGNTPFAFNATSDGAFDIHFNTNANCGTEGACRSTAIHCISCGAKAGCMDPAAVNYDPDATYNDCNCILPNLPNDDCLNAMSLDTWLNVDGNCTMTSNSTYSGATATFGEVAPSSECADGDINPKDVWYSLTIPSSGVVTFKFMSTPGFSSVVECYTGTCGSLSAYAPILCNNEDERTFTGLTPGSTAYFRVWDYGSNDLGNHELCVRGEISGCTDPNALNYNPSATFNDGSCNYPTASKPCTANILSVNGPCVVGDNSGLGMEPGEPTPDCFGGDNHSLWYKFIAQSNITTITTDFSGYTSKDTEVAIYEVGSCFNYNTYVQMDCDQDGGVTEEENSVISNVPTNIGSVYYIQVSGWNGKEGTFCLQVTSPPANDQICGAQAISCGDITTSTTSMFSQNESDMPVEGCGTALTSSNVFYVLNGTGNDVHLSLCNSTFDTRLNVYCLNNGSCGSNPSFYCVGSNDDSPSCSGGANSEISFATQAGNQYYIMVHGYGNNIGDYELSVNCSAPKTPPANQDCEDNGLACRLMGTARTISPNNVCTMMPGNNVAAANVIKNPTCVASANKTYSNVWYTFNSGSYTAFDIEVEEITASDVRHAFYENCGGEALFCDESTVYGLSMNTDYFLQVFTAKDQEGDFNICIKPLEVCAFLVGPTGNEVNINSVLEWSATPFATGYQVMIGTTSGGDDILTMTDVGNNLSYTPSTFDYNTTYYVTLQPYDNNGDINGCPGFTFTTACPVINTQLESIVQNDCAGATDAGIDISVSGGVGPYTYKWSGPNDYTNATEDIVQVPAGEYTVLISDTDNGCETVVQYTIPETMSITAQVNIVDQACANDGSVEVVMSGGTPPYTYFWNNGATTAEINNMSAGIFSVEVTDSDGCSVSFDSIEIVNSGGVQSSIVNITGVGCGSTNGSITISPENGESPYSYSWISLSGITLGNVADIPGAYEIKDLPLGTYNITVTDANGCNGLAELLTVPMIGELTPTISLLQNVDCNNNLNGNIAVTTDFGSAPFQFNWSNGFGEISQTGTSEINNVAGGTYSVTVTDANGCVGSLADILVFEPLSLNLSIAGIDGPLCYGDSSGGIKTLIEGGVPPYNYLWSDGSTTSDLIDVGIGEYMLTVTDDNGCVAVSVPVSISEVSPIEINLIALNNLSCFDDNDGSIYMNLFGGNPPYTLEWNNGATTANLNNLTGGEYQCTITDSKGCTIISDMYDITAPEAILDISTANIETVSCEDMNDGAIDVTIAGGTPPYVYTWSNGEDTEDITDLSPGNYLLTITDANNCMYISELMFIDEPLALSGIGSATPDFNGQGTGTATIQIVGGTEPYEYLWDEAAENQTEPTANNLTAGNYSVTVTDNNSCLFVTTVEVGMITDTRESTLTVNRLELFPNPTKRDAQLLVNLNEVAEIDIRIYDISGKEVVGAQNFRARKLLTIIDLYGEPDGVYLVKVKTGNEENTLLLLKRE